MNRKIETLLEKTKIDVATEIANQLSAGFFDDRMVSDIANIVGKHFEKYSEKITNEYTELISITGTQHCFSNNDYGIGYADGRNDASFMIKSYFEVQENEQNKS